METSYDCPVCKGGGTLKLHSGGWTDKGNPRLIYWCASKNCAVTLILPRHKSDKVFDATARELFKARATRMQRWGARLAGHY